MNINLNLIKNTPTFTNLINFSPLNHGQKVVAAIAAVIFAAMATYFVIKHVLNKMGNRKIVQPVQTTNEQTESQVSGSQLKSTTTIEKKRFMLNGVLYDGIFENDQFIEGKMIADTGTYEGKFVNEQLVEGKAHFKKRYTSDEYSFEGKFIGDKLEGQGKIKDALGRVYKEGLFAKGELVEGKIYSRDDIFEGTFVDGKLEGQGKVIDVSSGKIYKEGKFEKGKLVEGKLVERDEWNKEYSEGTFKDELLEGKGKIIVEGKVYKEGLFEKGELIDGKAYLSYGLVIHEGKFDKGKLVKGKIYSNGLISEGTFVNGLLEGRGKVIKAADGTVIEEGIFEQDRLIHDLSLIR